MNDKLRDLRANIDALDNRIIALLEERAAAAIEIGRHKAANDQALYVPERQKEILNRLVALNRGPLPHASIGRIFGEIMTASLALELHDHVLCGGAEPEAMGHAVAHIVGGKSEVKVCRTPDELIQAFDGAAATVAVVTLDWVQAICNACDRAQWAGCWRIGGDGETAFHLVTQAAMPATVLKPVTVCCLVDEAARDTMLSSRLIEKIPARSAEAYPVSNEPQSTVIQFRLETNDAAEVSRIVGELAQAANIVWTI